jgi:hypothetical protein
MTLIRLPELIRWSDRGEDDPVPVSQSLSKQLADLLGRVGHLFPPAKAAALEVEGDPLQAQAPNPKYATNGLATARMVIEQEGLLHSEVRCTKAYFCDSYFFRVKLRHRAVE